MSDALFVYGTLMTDGGQAGLLRGLKRAPAKVRGQLFRMPAGYPALVLGGREWAHGELVHDVDAARLALLDQYEGVDEGLYARVRAEVVVGVRPITAWTYVMEAPHRRGGRLLSDGRWRRVRRR